MRIDPTIYAAIEAEMLTPGALHLALAEVMDVVERTVLKQAAAQAIADGFAETDVALVLERCARELREGRAQRLAGAHVVLDRELAREVVH